MSNMDDLTKGNKIKVFSYYDGESDEETTYKKGRIAIVKRGINPPACDYAIIEFIDNGEYATINYATDEYELCKSVNIFKFDLELLRSDIEAFNADRDCLRKEIIDFLSKLDIKFNRSFDISMVDPANDIENYKTPTSISAIDDIGILFDEDGEEGMEYEDICTDDLLEIMEGVIKTEEFKKKYLK